MKTRTTMPAETRQYIIHMMEGYFGLSVAEVWRHLLRRWVNWSEDSTDSTIPGYDSCPPATRSGLPAGWSLTAFQRIAKQASLSPDKIRIIGTSLKISLKTSN